MMYGRIRKQWLPVVTKPVWGRKPTAATTTRVLDNFTDADTTAIASHTIAPTNTPSTSWTAQVGKWTISGNKAVTTAVQSAHATCNPGVSDCVITAKVKTTGASGAANSAGIVARWTDTTHLWSVFINQADDLITIREADGSGTDRATAAATIDNTSEYTIVATFAAAVVSATVNGASPVSYSSATSNQTVTVHGIKARAAADTIDDFQVVA